MDLVQIIYSSQPFGFDQPTLDGVLMQARRNNKRDDISGALICRQDLYLQLLEGPEDKIQATYERIKQDDRHMEVTLQASRPVSARTFGAWDMLHDPARSWLWSPEELAKGALKRTSAEDVTAIFTQLAERMKADGAL
jgi:hypothetical protein